MRLKYLQEYLTLLFKTVADNVYFEQADEDDLFPHVVYSLSSVNSSSRTDYLLEVNVWDDISETDGSTIRIDDLADEIEIMFDEYYFIDEHMQFRTYKNTRNNVEDTNKNLRRRRLTFTLYLYGR